MFIKITESFVMGVIPVMGWGIALEEEEGEEAIAVPLSQLDQILFDVDYPRDSDDVSEMYVAYRGKTYTLEIPKNLSDLDREILDEIINPE